MYSNIFKNFEINLGLPFQVKVPVDEIELAPVSINAKARSGNANAGTGAGVGVGAEADTVAENAEAEAETVIETPESIIERALSEAEQIVLTARAEGAEAIAAASAEAARIVAASSRDAEMHYNETMARASKEAEGLRVQAMRDGDREGRAEGRAAYDSLIADAKQLRDETEEEYRKSMKGAEGDALELIIKIAKKVIGEEVSLNRENLIYLVEDAFSHCAYKEDVLLKVSAADYDYICDNQDELLSRIGGVDKLDIKRDLSLAPGACLVETPFGSLDAGISTRLSKVEDAFRRVLAATRPAAESLSA